MYDYRMTQSDRQFLARNIAKWVKGKKNNRDICHISAVLGNEGLPMFHDEEIKLWETLMELLKERRKNTTREEFLTKAEHARDSLKHPEHFNGAYRCMNTFTETIVNKYRK